MADILVVYGSSYGQTAKVARRIADLLEGMGHWLSIWCGEEVPVSPGVEGFDAVVVAGSVRFGRHQRYLESFVRTHVAQLNAMPSAFVSLCGALAGGLPTGQSRAKHYVQRFVHRTGWRPQLSRSFAGGLPYTRYGPLTRWFMRRISRRTGRPTDTSRDWEFTDWDAVERFAEDLDRSIGALHLRHRNRGSAVASEAPTSGLRETAPIGRAHSSR